MSDRLLIISDLHPEKGVNRKLREHLLNSAAGGRRIVFNGDCLQFPNSYKSVPHISIAGNHDSGKCDTRIWSIADEVITHSHLWDPAAESGGLLTDSLWSWFQYAFFGKDLPLGCKPVVTALEKMLERPVDGAEVERIRARILPDLEFRGFRGFRVLAMGHRHKRYAVEVDGVLCINSGAGWKGEYVTIDDDGVLFHSWK